MSRKAFGRGPVGSVFDTSRGSFARHPRQIVALSKVTVVCNRLVSSVVCTCSIFKRLVLRHFREPPSCGSAPLLVSGPLSVSFWSMPSGRNQNIHVDAAMSLADLAAEAAEAVVIIANTNEQGLRIKKLKLGITWRSKTVAEGPLTYGLSVDLSDAEIAEAIVAAPIGIGAIPATEQGNRKVFPLGIISRDSVGQSADDAVHIEEIKKFPFREIREGSSLSLYVFNHGAQLTTGTVVEAYGVIVGRWLND